jgi:hypothetical protein
MVSSSGSHAMVLHNGQLSLVVGVSVMVDAASPAGVTN